MKKPLIAFLLALATTQALASMWDRPCRTGRLRTIAEQLANLGPSAELELVDLELFPGGSVVAGYEYEVEPSYTNGYYARTDRWQISTRAIPRSEINLAEGLNFRIGAGGQHQTEATFVRFFQDACVAETARPYSPRRIPLRATQAIGPRFNVGDYFILRSSLGFTVGADILQLFGSTPVGIGADARFLAEGSYQVHVVRLDQNRVRLKIIARRGREARGSVFVGVQKFEVFGLAQVGRGVRQLVDPKPVEITLRRGDARIFLVDYVLDLRDPAVADAYNKILLEAREFQSLRLAAPFRNDVELEKNLVLDLSPLDRIFRADYEANQVGRIRRNLRTSSRHSTSGWEIELGNRLFGFDWDVNGSTAQMALRQPDHSLDRYLMRSWETTSEGHFLFSWSKTEKERAIQGVFSADERYQDLEPVNLVMRFGRRDNRFSHGEFLALKRELHKALPTPVYEAIPWNTWAQREGRLATNFGLRCELVLSPEALDGAPQLSKDEVARLFDSHLRSKGLTPDDFYRDDSDRRTSAEDRYQRALNIVANTFSQAFDRRRNDRQRLESFFELRRNKLFEQAGFSFLMALRPDQARAWFRVDVNLSSNEHRLDFAWGDQQLSDLYKKLLTVKAALEDDALDLRREAESLSHNI